jgi:hypothetical protein
MQVQVLGQRSGRRPLLNDILAVVGIVSLACGVWQIAGGLGEQWNVSRTRSAIRQEMAADLDRIAYRLQAQPCILRRLNEIDTLLASGSVVPAGGKIGVPGAAGLDDEQWQAGLGNGLVNRQSDTDQTAQTFFYTSAHLLDAYAHEEFQAWNVLRSLEMTPPDAETRPRLLAALQTARGDAAAFASLARDTLAQARSYGMTADAGRTPTIANTSCRPLRGS